MNAILQDVRYALRQLRNKPGFALTTVLTLALGIGANVAIFSAINGFILRPLPVPHPEQLVVLVGQQQGAPLGVYFLSFPEFVDLRKQADTFSNLFAYENTLGGMSADNKAAHFVGSHVSGNYSPTRRQVLKLALRQGLWAVLAGAGTGLLLAVMVSRGIANLLVGVSATDSLTYLGSTLFLIAVALFACFIPARRAAKVAPMVALRYE